MYQGRHSEGQSMKCMMNGCKDEFVDSQDGLSAMLFHMMLHPVEQINTPEQNKMCAEDEPY